MEPVTTVLAIAGLLAKVAPSIVGMISGKDAQKKAEKVVEIAKEVTGIQDEQKAAETILEDPNLILQFKQSVLEYQLEEQRLWLADRQSAREADVAKTSATGRRDYAMYVLAALIVTGFFVLTGILCFHTLPAGSTEAVFLLFGSLSGAFGSVVGYFFGSSKSSQDKTLLLADKGGTK